MLTLAEARNLILAGATRLGTEPVPLLACLGRVLAEPVVASSPLPAFDYSAMDGYAVATSSFEREGPVELPVVGESRTGAVAPPLVPGSTCRIFTGAALPRGADAVVMQEDVERRGERARFGTRPRPWQHVRRMGEDLAEGTIALEAGVRLSAGAIALIAALDRDRAVVARKPRVGILCTGDELRPPGSEPRPGSIPESNGIALALMVRSVGGEPELLPYVRDDAARTEAAIRDALVRSDLLLTVGGVSVGEHDVVRPALEAAGAKLEFWKVKLRPGKPLTFGRAGATRVLGLPGNPVSAQVAFALFGAPLVRALQGDRRPLPSMQRMRLGAPVVQKTGRTSMLRARCERGIATPLANQASGAPTMAWADGLVVVPEDSTGFPEGAEVDVLVLSDI
jgi:molybdopterin molybdotransferase